MSQYTIEPCGGGGDWYFVTDGQWVEGGDMSESTARAIAERLNQQAAEIERLRNLVATQDRQECCEEVKRQQREEVERLRDAVAYLRGHVQTPEPQQMAWCWLSVWQEFERRIDASGSRTGT
jgi:polyhydroxyalkanoate synthesis regulator phasin